MILPQIASLTMIAISLKGGAFLNSFLVLVLWGWEKKS